MPLRQCVPFNCAVLKVFLRRTLGTVPDTRYRKHLHAWSMFPTRCKACAPTNVNATSGMHASLSRKRAQLAFRSSLTATHLRMTFSHVVLLLSSPSSHSDRLYLVPSGLLSFPVLQVLSALIMTTRNKFSVSVPPLVTGLTPTCSF
jgi:hypothetical protein